ncbi:MAG: penicillin-binding transpeptidase domain-containing protein, partial [Candidatus Cloacimonadota bacterium]|nr:penicillin-binding transpeptidase domain-containing protein [Candidatus Cloacimonadota bacterium]
GEDGRLEAGGNEEKTEDPNTILSSIAEIISTHSNLKKEDIEKKLLLSSSNSVYITDDLSESEISAIESDFADANISGMVKTFSKIERNYPKGRLAARLLGMVKQEKTDNRDLNNNSIYTQKGVCGIEATYNKELAGQYGWKEVIRDAKNNRFPAMFLREEPPQNGYSIYLTIDNRFQEILEENLQNGLKEYEAKHAIGIIMEPNTGKIKAMAGFADTDTLKSARELRSLPNLPASFMFEPGSSLKPITVLLALEKNLYKPNEKINCQKYEMENRVIKDDHEYDKLNLRDIIAYSSNVGISKTVEKIGAKALYDRLIAMNFGHKTGSNLFGEMSGIFRKLSDWQGFSLHSISFGQEISTTALQLANAYCAIANGGKVMQPYILEKITDSKNNIIKESKPRILRKISTPTALDSLRSYLQSVVDYGTATATKLPHITIGGKTGTAEKIITGQAGYSEDKFTSVFAGFFPVKKPSYVMVIVYDEADYDSYAYYASMSAVPTFKEVLLDIDRLNDVNITANAKFNETNFVKMPNLMGKTKNEAVELLNKNGISYLIRELAENGLVVNQFPKPGVSFGKDKKVIVILDTEEKKPKQEFSYDTKMPDLRGLSLKKALSMANKAKVKLIIKGSGKVQKQSIAPGTETKFGEKCLITAE